MSILIQMGLESMLLRFAVFFIGIGEEEADQEANDCLHIYHMRQRRERNNHGCTDVPLQRAYAYECDACCSDPPAEITSPAQTIAYSFS